MLLLRPRQRLQIVVQDVDVGDRVGVSGVLDDQVIDGHVLALLEADPEIRLRQGAEVVADFGALARHVDDHCAVRQLLKIFVLVGLQHTHEAEILGRDLVVEVALQDSVRHLVAEDDEPAAAGTEKGFHAALYVFVYALVVFVEDDQNRVNPLKIGHFGRRLLGKKLLKSML